MELRYTQQDYLLKSIALISMKRNHSYPIAVLKKILWYLGTFRDRVALPWLRKTRFKLKRPLGKIYKVLFRKNYTSRYVMRILQDYYGYTGNFSGQNVRVYVLIQDGLTSPKSSAFIRLISPLSILEKQGKLSFKIIEHPDQLHNDSDICLVQRTALKNIAEANRLADRLYNAKSKLIVDVDDNFSLIDGTHPEHNILKKRSDALNAVVEKANLTLFSTPELLRSYSSITKRSSIYINRLDDTIWNGFALPEENTNRDGPIRLLYMGTATHDADFELILPALDELHLAHPDTFRLSVVGVSNAIPARNWIDRLVPEHGSIYPRFVEWFVQQNKFDIGLSPLVDNPFNRSKSDIKCLDYMAIGAVPMVSSCLAYSNPELDNIIIRVNNNDWYNILSDTVSSPSKYREEFAKMRSAGNNYLQSKRTADRTAKELHAHINQLVGGDKKS
jgi:O-antigen biosynthesis protein